MQVPIHSRYSRSFNTEGRFKPKCKNCRFKVGLGLKKRLYICDENDILKYPQTILAKCLTMFKEDGRKKDNYIEIPHEGRYFKEILEFMSGDQEPLRRKFLQDRLGVRDEIRYHCLDVFGFDVLEDGGEKPTKRCGPELTKPELSHDVFNNILHVIHTIGYTCQPIILILNYVDDRQSVDGPRHTESGARHMKTLMDRVDPKQCRVFGFEGDMLELSNKQWTQSALVFGWREHQESRVESNKWYHNLDDRKCLLEQPISTRKDLIALIDRLKICQ